MTSSSNPSKAALYGRFIPSEEINAVSAWRFANVDGTPHPEEIAAPVMPAGPTPEEIEALVQQARREAFDQGHAAGRAQGEAETRQTLQAPMEQAQAEWLQRFDALLSTLDQQLAQRQHPMTEAVLDMACSVARQVLRRELEIDTQTLEPVVREAIEQLGADAKPLTIRLHPDDLGTMEATLADSPSEHRPRLVADESITPGGCMVQTPGSTVDATIERRWQRTIANLGLSQPWEAAAASSAPADSDDENS